MKVITRTQLYNKEKFAADESEVETVSSSRVSR